MSLVRGKNWWPSYSLTGTYLEKNQGGKKCRTGFQPFLIVYPQWLDTGGVGVGRGVAERGAAAQGGGWHMQALPSHLSAWAAPVLPTERHCCPCPTLVLLLGGGSMEWWVAAFCPHPPAHNP